MRCTFVLPNPDGYSQNLCKEPATHRQFFNTAFRHLCAEHAAHERAVAEREGLECRIVEIEGVEVSR